MQSQGAYFSRSQEYWKQAKEFLKQRHFLKVSELAWGSMVQMAHALAVKQGVKLRRHVDIKRYIYNIASRLGDKEMAELFDKAEKLHVNFYHEILEEVEVKESFAAVQRLLEKIGQLLVKEVQ